jgi:hypothetical protein
MAHQWRKTLCADDEMRLVKSMALLACAITFFQRRIPPHRRKKRGHNQLAPVDKMILIRPKRSRYLVAQSHTPLAHWRLAGGLLVFGRPRSTRRLCRFRRQLASISPCSRRLFESAIGPWADPLIVAAICSAH